MHASQYLDENYIIICPKQLKSPQHSLLDIFLIFLCHLLMPRLSFSLYQDAYVLGFFWRKFLHVEARTRLMVVGILLEDEFRCAL